MSCSKTKQPTSQNGFIAFIKNRAKQNKAKRSVWVCSCGCVVPKKGALLAGGPQYKYDFHVHCPRCSRIVAQFVDPKETR